MTIQEEPASPETTVEDMMPTDALLVSPILTPSIFDENFTSNSSSAIQNSSTYYHRESNSSPSTTEQLSVHDSTATLLPLPLPAPIITEENVNPQFLDRNQLYRATTNVNSGTTTSNDRRFMPPPPSNRWRRRLDAASRLDTTTATYNTNDDTSAADRRAEYNETFNRRHTEPITPISSSSSPSSHRSDSFPTRTTVTSRFVYGQNCLNGKAVDTTTLMSEDGESSTIHMLDFDVIFDDGGQYGTMYGIDNLLLNDGSVYCSGRKGVVNILAQYCGYVESGLLVDITCSISKLIIKAPQHGFTAPCKDGLIFMSHKQIDVSKTSMFDSFSQEDYNAYIENKLKTNDNVLNDDDPVAFFTLSGDRTNIIDLNERSGKFILIKLLRSDFDSDNIDLQYVGFIGHSGARSFGCARLC